MGSTVFRNPWQIHLGIISSAVRFSVSVVFGKCKPLHEREELVLVGGKLSTSRRFCGVVEPRRGAEPFDCSRSFSD